MTTISSFTGICSPIAPAGGVLAGYFYLIQGTLFCSTANAAVGAPFSGFAVFNATDKIFQGVPKATGQTWTAGQNLYWDNTAKNFTTTSTSNTLVGIAANAQASGDTLADMIPGKQI